VTAPAERRHKEGRFWISRLIIPVAGTASQASSKKQRFLGPSAPSRYPITIAMDYYFYRRWSVDDEGPFAG
jgi:hypothetical protein